MSQPKRPIGFSTGYWISTAAILWVSAVVVAAKGSVIGALFLGLVGIGAALLARHNYYAGRS